MRSDRSAEPWNAPSAPGTNRGWRPLLGGIRWFLGFFCPTAADHGWQRLVRMVLKYICRLHSPRAARRRGLSGRQKDFSTSWCATACASGRNARQGCSGAATGRPPGCAAGRPRTSAPATRSSSFPAAQGCAPCRTGCGSISAARRWTLMWISSPSRPAARCRTCSTSAPASPPAPTRCWRSVRCPGCWPRSDRTTPPRAGAPPGCCAIEPVLPLVLPVRDMRVLYALKQPHYEGFARHQLAAPA